MRPGAKVRIHTQNNTQNSSVVMEVRTDKQKILRKKIVFKTDLGCPCTAIEIHNHGIYEYILKQMFFEYQKYIIE